MERADGRRADRRLDLALVALFLAAVAPFVQTLTAQGASRYALTAALVEQGTWRLDDYAPIVGIDRVEIDGHLLSDKAPGQPWLGVPVLAVAEAVGADPATDFSIRSNLGLWSQTLAFCTIPAAVLLVLMRRHARRHVDARWALLGAAGLSGTTILLPYASHFSGHVFAATLVFGAWHLLTDPRPERSAEVGRIVGAGALAGLAIVSEYPTAIAVAVLGLWVLLRHGVGRAAAFSVPVLVGGAVVVGHNLAVYGSWKTGYSQKGTSATFSASGVPDPGHLAQILFGDRGFIYTPVVLAALVALTLLTVRDPRSWWAPALVVVGYVALQAGWTNPWGGDAPGPRYALTALPFLVVPAAVALHRVFPPLRVALLAIGSLSMVPILFAETDLVGQGSRLVETHLRRIGDGGLTNTLFTIAFGPAGWAVHAALVVAAATHLARVVRDSLDDSPGDEDRGPIGVGDVDGVRA